MCVVFTFEAFFRINEEDGTPRVRTDFILALVLHTWYVRTWYAITASERLLGVCHRSCTSCFLSRIVWSITYITGTPWFVGFRNQARYILNSCCTHVKQLVSRGLSRYSHSLLLVYSWSTCTFVHPSTVYTGEPNISLPSLFFAYRHSYMFCWSYRCVCSSH